MKKVQVLVTDLFRGYVNAFTKYIKPANEFNFECQFMGLTEKGTQITSTIPFDIKEAVQVCTLCSLNKCRITQIECVTSRR